MPALEEANSVVASLSSADVGELKGSKAVLPIVLTVI